MLQTDAVRSKCVRSARMMMCALGPDTAQLSLAILVVPGVPTLPCRVDCKMRGAKVGDPHHVFLRMDRPWQLYYTML